MKQISIETKSRDELIDITGAVAKYVRNSGIKDGICVVYVPHTTAGVTINENADPNVVLDIISQLGKIVPWDGGYRHMEGNAAAHIKSTIVGMSKTIPIKDGRLALGTWQSIFFCEFDGPRRRKVYIKIIEG